MGDDVKEEEKGTGITVVTVWASGEESLGKNYRCKVCTRLVVTILEVIVMRVVKQDKKQKKETHATLENW